MNKYLEDCRWSEEKWFKIRLCKKRLHSKWVLYRSFASGITVLFTMRLWMMPSRRFPLVTAFMYAGTSPSVKCVSVPSSTNSPCKHKKFKIRKEEEGRHSNGKWITFAYNSPIMLQSTYKAVKNNMLKNICRNLTVWSEWLSPRILNDNH